MKNFTFAEVVAATEKVVEGREDYVYVNPNGEKAGDEGLIDCFYVQKDEYDVPCCPSCVVGHVLNDMGVDLLEMSLREGSNASELMYYLRVNGVIDMDDKSIAFLNSIQGRQDEGMPWGEALRRAKKVVE